MGEKILVGGISPRWESKSQWGNLPQVGGENLSGGNLPQVWEQISVGETSHNDRFPHLGDFPCPSVSELIAQHTNPSGLEVSKINQQDNSGITGRGTVSMASDFIFFSCPFQKISL